jgi:hypothetical protein
MKILVAFLSVFLFIASARANERTVCIEDICRTVQEGPLPDMAQELPKPAAHGPRIADLKFWLATGINIGVSVATTWTIARCRADHGIGPCQDGGYGEFKTREGLRQGLTGGLTLVSFEIKKIEDTNGDRHKFWWLFPVGETAVNASVIIENAARHFGPKEVR